MVGQENMNYSTRYSVLFAMLRSFTTLARTLNLSKTVDVLGTTRQTVRRHISLLEEVKGETLLRMQSQRYVLTEAGADCLADAEAIMANVDDWVASRRLTTIGQRELAYASFRDEATQEFHAQQHPLSRLNGDCACLLRSGFRAWAKAGFEIEDPAMDEIRPYLVVYRKHRDDWFIVSIGGKSAYATWMSWEWAKSAIGQQVADSPTSPEVTEFVTGAYDEVLTLGNARLDHLITQLSRQKGEPPQPISYQRLLLCCRFPDGSPAVASLIVLTDKIDIKGLDPDMIPDLSEDARYRLGLKQGLPAPDELEIV